ncbi:MAG: tRNA uridine(34) 5-carboxymethylaminomethyl modification radical SAM/GNAT enzyme Elp3 [archaeon]|nr:MAG: tRNA uridine(34) 5-carboxymethylaminomethyl modification radical SAM/GNAT enzyme Elp3 [archaeon]
MTLQEGPRDSDALAFIAQSLERGQLTHEEVERLKKTAARLFGLGRFPSNSEILSAVSSSMRGQVEEVLKVHPRRSASGIVVVTAFSAPYSCPHGTCVFCPGGPRFGTPQSYLPESPGMAAALELNFSPSAQVERSLAKYRANGHPTDKVETIIEGGTFLAVPAEYQVSFVKGVFEGLNGHPSSSLASAQSSNEEARSRCVGLTLETKPDWCGPQDADLMLEYGVTRVELGVQTLRDETLSKANRGHTVADAVEAMRVARDAGLKVAVHMMPGLPGAYPDEDLKDLRRLFEDPDYRPDMMKVYPTLVVPGTALARQFEAGLFVPYGLETVVELLSEMKRAIPSWHRIMRIQREIPEREISGGVNKGNLRQLVLQRATRKGISCRCIRCREVALDEPEALEEDDSLRYSEQRYEASGGTEVFGSYEFKRSGRIAGFVRARIPSPRAHRAEASGSLIVRELRVYGRALEIGGRDSRAWQHSGLGSSLMGIAEALAREQGARRVLVTSAVGTRNYYRKLGYERLGPYMAKSVV